MTHADVGEERKRTTLSASRSSIEDKLQVKSFSKALLNEVEEDESEGEIDSSRFSDPSRHSEHVAD